MNQQGIMATSTATGTSTTATASAIAQRKLQVIGFSASSSDQAFKVELKFGSTVKWTMRGAADSSAGMFFSDNGPVAAENEAVTVVTTPDASGTVDANLLYRIIF